MLAQHPTLNDLTSGSLSHVGTASKVVSRGVTTVAAQSDVTLPNGEMAFRASVLGCDGALSGHVYLDRGGRAAYIADGVQIVGRGVGHWLVDGKLAAVELDVYQYAAAAANIPDKPHRFRGIWALDNKPGPLQGDWYFCPEKNEAPRLVGGFTAAAAPSELLAEAVGTRSSLMPTIHGAARDALMAALDAQPLHRLTAPWAEPNTRLEPYRLGELPNVYYIPDWIEPEQEAEFLSIADKDMSAWEDMKTRSSQEWGAGDRCACGRGLMRQPLPPQQQPLADALHQLGLFDGALFPMNSVRINGYKPGQGIHPHCDGPVYYPKVAILSLGSPCLFTFYQRTGTEDCIKWDLANDVPGGHTAESKPHLSVLVEPRSLLVFSDDAFWHHRHGISAVSSELVTKDTCNLASLNGRYKEGDIIERKRRVSLTMRHLLPRCACQG